MKKGVHSRRECPLKAAGPTLSVIPRKGLEKSGRVGAKIDENSSPEKNTWRCCHCREAAWFGPEIGNRGEATPERVTGLLSEATTLLKTFKPAARVVKIKRVNSSDGPKGLLDGGATNALRRVGRC